MKAYEIIAQQQPAKRKKDNSLTLTFYTGEVDIEEYVEIIKNDNQLGTLVWVPNGQEEAPVEKINSEMKEKKPHVRLYNILWVWWKQNGEPGDDFYPFYKRWMEKRIQAIKDKLEPKEQ